MAVRYAHRAISNWNGDGKKKPADAKCEGWSIGILEFLERQSLALEAWRVSLSRLLLSNF
jgi:hypothetical protein